MKLINTENAPKAIGPYSQAYISNGMLYCSGQIPIDPATGNIPNGIEAQAEQSCKNCGELLKAAGLSFDNVVKVTVYIQDMDDFAKLNEVYAKYFTTKPARSCVAVKTIPKNCLCEIDMIAECN